MKKLKYVKEKRVFGGEFLEIGEIYNFRLDEDLMMVFLIIKDGIELALYEHELKYFEVID